MNNIVNIVNKLKLSRKRKRNIFRFMQFNFGWYGHAIFKDGKYPEVMRRNIDRNSQLQGLNISRLPEFTPEVIVCVCLSVVNIRPK